MKKEIEIFLKNNDIGFENCDLKIFEKRSFYRFKLFYKELRTFLDLEDKWEFNQLNTLWKANTVFARFIFKYSLFIENYVEASIDNYSSYNKTKYIDKLDELKIKLNKHLVGLKDIKGQTDKHLEKIIKDTKKKINIVKKYFVEKEVIQKLKFVEKNYIYKNVIFNNIDANAFCFSPYNNLNKIRTLRNKAVHHHFVLDECIKWKSSSLNFIFGIVDEIYKTQFITEINDIMKKYNLESYSFIV